MCTEQIFFFFLSRFARCAGAVFSKCLEGVFGANLRDGERVAAPGNACTRRQAGPYFMPVSLTVSGTFLVIITAMQLVPAAAFSHAPTPAAAAATRGRA
jgi:hypothetical protein